MKKFLQGAALAVLFFMACLMGYFAFNGDESTHLMAFNETPEPSGMVEVIEPSIENDTISTTESSATPEPSPMLEPPESTPETPTVTTGLGTLKIGGKDIPIADNVDESTLEESPGHMPDTALPGETGTSVILGHRNRKHLRSLEDVEVGDVFSFAYPDGREVEYTVSEIIVYEDTADWRIPVVAGDALVLVTCYPFRYSGNAPGKWVVVGVRVR